MDRGILDKQKQFIPTVKRNPAYGAHVRKLSWTVLDTNSYTWRWYTTYENYDKRKDDEPEPDVYEPEDGKPPYAS